MTEKQTAYDFSKIKSKLWSPGSSIAEVSETEIEEADYKKDAIRPKVDPNLQLRVLISSLQLLSSVVHDTHNTLTKEDAEDVITACELAQTRSFEAFVSLGRMVTSVRHTDPETDEIAIQMGDIWDRTDYSHIKPEQIAELSNNFQQELSKAYAGIELIEDQWIDERTRENQEKNETQVQTWVQQFAPPLTSVVRQLSVAVNQRREAFEATQERPKYNSLGEALKAKDVEEFAKYFNKNTYDVQNPDEKKVLDALMRAAVQFGAPTAIPLIAAKGGDINQSNPNGQTLFMQAISTGDVDGARALRDAGALVYEKDLNGYTELMLAAKNGQVGSLKYLVEELKMDATNEDVGINKASLKGFTALIYAAHAENYEAVDYLLQKGADPLVEVWSEAREDGAPTALDYTETPEIEELLRKSMRECLNKQAKKAKP